MEYGYEASALVFGALACSQFAIIGAIKARHDGGFSFFCLPPFVLKASMFVFELIYRSHP